MTTYTQPSALPTSKVTAGAAAGAVVTVALALAEWLTDLPAPPAGLEGAGVLLAYFAVAYFKRERTV